MIRQFFCILLVAITGFTRIALAEPTQDLNKARYELHLALRHAVLDIVQAGERTPDKVANLALQRAQTEVAKFREVGVARYFQIGLRRSEAEANITEEVSGMLQEMVEITLFDVKGGIPLPPK
jgi:hypothetical protein